MKKQNNSASDARETLEMAHDALVVGLVFGAVLLAGAAVIAAMARDVNHPMWPAWATWATCLTYVVAIVCWPAPELDVGCKASPPTGRLEQAVYDATSWIILSVAIMCQAAFSGPFELLLIGIGLLFCAGWEAAGELREARRLMQQPA